MTFIFAVLLVFAAILYGSASIEEKRIKAELQRLLDEENDLERIKSETEELKKSKLAIEKYLNREFDKYLHSSQCRGIIKAMRYAEEENREIHKWRHFARHAKKVRTRKKYEKLLDAYYRTHPIVLPSAIDSARPALAAQWWAYTAGAYGRYYNTYGPRSGPGGGSK